MTLMTQIKVNQITSVLYLIIGYITFAVAPIWLCHVIIATMSASGDEMTAKFLDKSILSFPRPATYW